MIALALAAAAARSLPDGNLIAGYGTNCADPATAQQKMISEAAAGVNVIIWCESE